MLYELVYNCEDGYDEMDIFCGTWLELQDFIKKAKGKRMHKYFSLCHR